MLRRYDEGEGYSEDDPFKRKKEFSELFKKQMSMRKVITTKKEIEKISSYSLGKIYVISKCKDSISRVFVLCLCTSVSHLGLSGPVNAAFAKWLPHVQWNFYNI